MVCGDRQVTKGLVPTGWDWTMVPSLQGQSHDGDDSRRCPRSQGEDKHQRIHVLGAGAMTSFSKMDGQGPPVLRIWEG